MSKSILLPILFLLCTAEVFGQGYTFDQAVMCGGVNGNQYYYDEKYTFVEGEPIIAWIRFSSLSGSRLQIFAEFPGLGTIQPTYECCGEVIGYYSPYGFGNLPAGNYSVNFSAQLVDTPYPPAFITTLNFTVVAPTSTVTVRVSTLRHDNGGYDTNDPYFLAQIDTSNQQTGIVSVASDSSEATLVEVIRNGSTSYKVFPTADPNGNLKEIYGSFKLLEENDTEIKFQYQHPSKLVPGLNINFSVLNESTGLTEFFFTFKTVRPPVLLLHGLTALGDPLNGGATMTYLKEYLAANHYASFQPSYIQNPNYNGRAPFDLSYPVVSGFINDLLESARTENKISAGKVDVVGYSMGGLLARMYLQHNIYHNNINKLITINTPHSGSELANNPIADLFAVFFHVPAVMDLKTTSDAIRISLNGPTLNKYKVPSHAIVSSTEDFANSGNCSFNVFPFEKIACFLNQNGLYFCGIGNFWKNCIFKGRPNDAVLSVISQAGGLPTNTYVGDFTNHLVVHKTLQTATTVDNLLGADATGSLFSRDGFYPPTLDARSESSDSREDLSIKIIQPLNGETVAAGQTIEVKVEGSPEVLASLLMAHADNLDTVDTHTANGSTATFNITVPLDASGVFQIGVIGKDADLKFVLDTITLNIQGMVGTYSNQDAVKIPYRVFPNPANQAVSVENLDADASMQCSLYTLDGKLKQQFEILPQSRFQLVTSDLTTGAYVLKMQTDRQVFTTRLVRL